LIAAEIDFLTAPAEWVDRHDVIAASANATG
jgi:hypothetical protein